MRIRSVLAVFVTAVVGAVVVHPAAATAGPGTPLGNCYANESIAFEDRTPVSAPGNRQTTWFTPLGLVNNDVIRITASGQIRIDHWGTSKSIAGELPVAGNGWPAPGVRRYMLIGKVTIGAMWLRSTGRTYGPNEWFPIGTDSDCMMYLGATPSEGGRLVVSFNDTNLSDNGGGASVTGRQWI